jgi:hypothetical protein
MGTRHLTIVRADKQLKVAQYGQWDGYPSGQGKNVLAFLRKMQPDHFRQQLKKVSFISPEKLKQMWSDAGADAKGMIAMEKADAFSAAHPELSRDTGSKILQLIDKHKGDTLELDNAHSFLTEGGFFGCEWAYEIDLDKKALNVYKDGNHIRATYQLDKLPTVAQMRKDCSRVD